MLPRILFFPTPSLAYYLLMTNVWSITAIFEYVSKDCPYLRLTKRYAENHLRIIQELERRRQHAFASFENTLKQTGMKNLGEMELKLPVEAAIAKSQFVQLQQDFLKLTKADDENEEANAMFHARPPVAYLAKAKQKYGPGMKDAAWEALTDPVGTAKKAAYDPRGFGSCGPRPRVVFF